MKIVETAAYLPPRQVTNDELASMVESSDEWIRQRTGIASRHICVEETTSSMAIAVARALLKKAHIAATEVQLIIVCTTTAEGSMPSVACQVQGEIGTSKAVAFDINAACSGFIYGLSTCEKMFQHLPKGYALIIGSEQMSRILDWQDRSTCVLFGDGAGGVLVENHTSESFILGEKLAADGQQANALTAQTENLSPFQKSAQTKMGVQMDGRLVYTFATKQVPKQIKTVMQYTALAVDQIDYFLLHQANKRMIKVIQKRLGASNEQVPINLTMTGNTSAASIPILLDEMVVNKQVTLSQEQILCLSGFGGGLTWGTLIIRI